MPTLFRFLAVLLTIGGIVFGLGIILTNTVEPEQRETIITIAPSRLSK